MLIAAICDSCGLAFATPNLIGGNMQATFENCGINCPRCGKTASIIDGVHKALGNTVRILVSSERSKSQLEALRHALKNAAQLRASREEILDTIKAHAPELQSLVDVIPQKRSELYPFVSMIVLILASIITAYGVFQKKGPTDAEIKAMVEKAVAEAMQPPAQPAPQNRAARRAHGRPSRPSRHK